MAPFKFPLDAYVLAVPMAYACAALGALVYNTLRNDPDQSNIAFYSEEPAKELQKANTYHNNPAQRFFSARAKGHETWGVFNNEFKAN